MIADVNRFPLARYIFERLIPQSRMRVVDAGASGGGETARWAFLGARLELHGFEADEAECRKLIESAPQGALIRYHNTFLGKPAPLRKFLIAKAFNNSFYPTDYSWYARKRSSPTGPPVRMSEMFAIAQTLDVESVSLDEWARRAGVTGIDYLKVDIEGAELELMESSPQMMTGVLAVSVDVTFHADWIGAPTFADVDAWMRAQGFVLFDLNGVKRGTQFDTPMVAPKNHAILAGQLACANAIYFRDPLVDGAKPISSEGRLKMAAIAEVQGQIEFAFELLRSVARNDRGLSTTIAEAERDACEEYRKMLAGERLAQWRNRIAAGAMAIVPRPLRAFTRRLSERIGLGNNPLFPY